LLRPVAVRKELRRSGPFVRAGRGKPPLPKSFWDEQPTQLAFAFPMCENEM
jgi:hypothetical protein